MEQFVFNEEMTLARAPRIGGIGLGWAGPTILLYGRDDQKKQHLPRILSGEDRWCQGFSEPGSGSDLASLQTRAVKDGDDYVVNGQKIWTSGAQASEWMILMARTDADAPKHKGISYFLLDMRTPGITVQPLQNMLGDADFNEVFFEDVRVPQSSVLGEEHRGWYIGTTTLDFERDPLERRPEIRFELADRKLEAEVARMMSYQVAWMQNAGQVPNKEASVAKLFSGELEQRIARTGVKALGLHGGLWGREAPARGRLSRMYAAGVSTTIGGGTSEIQRGIIAMRGLGMPRQ